TTFGMLLLSRLTATSQVRVVVIDLFILGLGLGLVTQVLTVALQSAVDREHLGAATSTNTLFRKVGSSIGISIFGAVFASHLQSRSSDPVRVAASMHSVFVVATAIAGCAFLLSLLL